MSRIVETYNRGRQYRNFSSTQDILNILVGSVHEKKQGEDPVILHDSGQSPGEGLTDDEWPNRLSFAGPMGIMFAAKVLRWSWCPKQYVKMVENGAETDMKSHNCKKGNDIASQLIQIEWHMCPDDSAAVAAGTSQNMQANCPSSSERST